ncbi:MAG: hypothetical protein ACI87J_002320 [Colwellia sp.]|jgi:hypothetical protein
MKNNTIFKTILSVAISASLVACGGGNDTTAKVEVPKQTIDGIIAIHSLDLTDTQGIFLTGNTLAQQRTAKVTTRSLITTSRAFSTKAVSRESLDVYEKNTAYKILKDGSIVELTIQDSQGADADRGAINIIHIDEITANYKIIYIQDQDFNSAIPYLLHSGSDRLFSLKAILGGKGIEDILGSGNSKWQYNNLSAVEGISGELFLDDDDSIQIISKPVTTDSSITAVEISDIVGSWTITQDSQYILYSSNNDDGTNNDDIYAVNTKTQARYDMNALLGKQLNTGRVMLDTNVVHSFDGNTYLYDFTSSGECLAYQITTGEDGLPSVKAKVQFLNTVNGYSSDPEDSIVSARDHGGADCINTLSLEQIVVGSDVYYKDTSNNLLTIDWNKKEFTNITHYFAKYAIPHGGNYNIAAELADQKNLKMALPKAIANSGDYIYRTGVFAESSNSYEIVEDGTASMDYLISDDVALERINAKTGETTVFFSKDSDFVLTTINPVADGTMYVTGEILSTGSAFFGTMDESGEVSVTSTSGSYDMPKIVTLMMINSTDLLAIDGNPIDWNIDYRTLSDDTNDQTSGDIDLSFYSEDTGNGFYYGLIEHTGELAKDTKIELTLSNGDTIVSLNDTFTHFDNLANVITTSNPSYAQGANFEFKLDLSAIGEDTKVTSVSVKSLADNIIDNME